MLAIARALVANPEIILLDEPMEGLAPLVARSVEEVVRNIRGEGHTVLLVEQNAQVAMSLSDRGYVLANGSRRRLGDDRRAQGRRSDDAPVPRSVAMDESERADQQPFRQAPGGVQRHRVRVRARAERVRARSAATRSTSSGRSGSSCCCFALTFMLIVQFWVMHYRVFRFVFSATKVDVALNFVLLAAVALLPYALRLYLKFPQSAITSIAYAAALGTGFALIAVLEVRGLRAHAGSLAPKPLRMMRNAVWRHALAGVAFLLSVPVIAVFGPDGRFAWGVIPLGLAIGGLIQRSRGAVRGTPAAAVES